jgi:predicted N-acyltransferase
MDIDELHTNYRGLDKAEVIKEGDSVNFTDVKNEIERIYQWENDYYEAADYRTQLPEENRKSIENEFATILSQLKEIAQLRANDISSLAQRRADIANSIRNLYRTIYGVFVQDYRGWRVENQGAR